MAAARYHIIIDINNVSNDILNDKNGIDNFLKAFPSTIGMHILHGPVVIEGVPQNPGVTGFVIIDYSHISMHTFTKFNQVLVDIFSCKPYDQQVAKQQVLEHFKVTESDAKIQQVSWE